MQTWKKKNHFWHHSLNSTGYIPVASGVVIMVTIGAGPLQVYTDIFTRFLLMRV
jgi:hypothetical protein